MTFYNENDKYAAQWLRNLANAGHISGGTIDERSIADLTAADLDGFERCHFFAGIAGWDYALRLAGWPEDRPVWTGSCPCQPFSQAGRRRGVADDRHLWPVWCELIREYRPATIFGEQVASKDGRTWLAGVRLDLEAMDYAVGAADLCAAGIGAPHIRQRLFWVANAAVSRRDGTEIRCTDQTHEGQRPRSVEPERSLSARGVADAERGATERQRFNLAGAACADQGRKKERQRIRNDPRDGVDSRGVGDTKRTEKARQRPVGLPMEPKQKTERRCNAVAWTETELIRCADGKARRVEPGICPLAHGVPARVGKLRAYGNAIVPQVAAEFIMAYIDTLTDSTAEREDNDTNPGAAGEEE